MKRYPRALAKRRQEEEEATTCSLVKHWDMFRVHMKVDGSKRCESPGKQQLIPLSLTCLTSARYLAPSRPLLVSQSPPTCLLILFGLLPPAFQLCRLPPTSPWSSTCCPLFPACFPLLRGLFPICHPLSPTAFLLASPWSRRSCPRTCLLLVSTCLPLVSCLFPTAGPVGFQSLGLGLARGDLQPSKSGMNPGTLKPWNPGTETLEPSNPATVEPWNLGTLAPWNPQGFWNPATLEPWNLGTLQPCTPGWHPAGILEPWNPGTLGNLGTLKPRDPGTLEPWNPWNPKTSKP